MKVLEKMKELREKENIDIIYIRDNITKEEFIYNTKGYNSIENPNYIELYKDIFNSEVEDCSIINLKEICGYNEARITYVKEEIMDIQVGDRVTYKNGATKIITNDEYCEKVKEVYGEILKIERPKYEVVEKKKELLTEEEKEFLKNMIKYYKVSKIIFSGYDVNIYEEEHIVNCPEYPDDLEFTNIIEEKKYTLSELGLE